jgi:hypothetical protein
MTTVSPNYDEATGQLIGMDVQPHRGGWSSSANDYIIDETTGKTHHVFDGVSLESEQQGFNEDDYFSTLAGSDPQISQALSWAANNLPVEHIADFNRIIDSGNIDDIHQALEILLNSYNTSPDNQLQEEEIVEDTLEVSEEEVTAEIATLQSADPDEGLVQEFMAAAVNSQDEAQQTLYMLAAEFHSGRLSADEAITEAFNRLPADQLYRAYSLINNN